MKVEVSREAFHFFVEDDDGWDATADLTYDEACQLYEALGRELNEN